MLTSNEAWCLHSDIIMNNFQQGEISKMQWT
jgi:hypothetical protein